MLLLERLLLKKANLCRLLKCELRVLAVDALGVDRAPARLDLNLDFQQILSVDFARSNKCKQESLVCGVDSLHFELDEHILQILVVSALGDRRIHILDVHGLAECMLHQVQVGLRILSVEELGHDLGAGLAQLTALVVHLAGLFEEDLAQNFFLLVVGVVVLDIVVVGLVEHRRRVVIAVWVLVSNAPHLVHDLGLRRVRPQRDLASVLVRAAELRRLECLVGAHVLRLAREVLASQ